MYACPILIGPSTGHRRIFAQIAYPLVREAQIVPLVYTEALDLAAWFPVVWQRTAESWRPVVLRTLRADGAAQPHGSPRAQTSLPLCLRAYPFIAERASREALWIDDIPADEPTNVGSAILDERGFPTRGAEQRLHASYLFQAGLAGTERITRFLAEREAFQPWPLELEVSDGNLQVEGLFVVDPALIESRAMKSFTLEFGVAGARMISAHAISLYRAATLFQRARQWSAQERAA